MKRILSVILCLCLIAVLLTIGSMAFQTGYTNIAVKIGDVTLPLPEYPVGSECESDRYYPLPNGGTVDVFGWQCLGFARYVFYRCFGVVDLNDEGGSSYHSVVYQCRGENLTEEYLRSIFGTQVLPGAHIRASNGSSGHSMVLLNCDDDYVYTYEGNYDYNNGVTVIRRTWEEFVSYCEKKGGIEFIHMPDSYPGWEPTDPPAPTEPEPSTTPPEPTETEPVPTESETDFSKIYSDMPSKDNWAYEGLCFALKQELFVGTTETTVSPDMEMSRAMLVTVLWRMAGEPEADTELGFADVHPNDWFAPAVLWAAEKGVVSGIGDGTFCPNQTVTREQIAAVMHRYVELCTDLSLQSGDVSEILGDYEDEDAVSGWAKEDMAWAVANGLISGKLNQEKLLLDAGGGGTRAEVASVIQRFCALLNG